MNDWNFYIEEQNKLCQKYDSLCKPISKDLKVGISADLNLEPLNGLRHNSEDGTTGWFIWSGEYEERDDFFQPICAEHLLNLKPEVLKYLGLDIGFRFLIGKDNYEDVWFDKKISTV